MGSDVDDGWATVSALSSLRQARLPFNELGRPLFGRVEASDGCVAGRDAVEAGTRRIRLSSGILGDRRVRGGPNPHGLVFPTVLGNLRDPRNTARDWAQARSRLGLGEYTFHSFRKTVATALDQAGLSARDIAEYLGHADPSLTMGTYMSKTVGGPKAANALDAVMGRG